MVWTDAAIRAMEAGKPVEEVTFARVAPPNDHPDLPVICGDNRFWVNVCDGLYYAGETDACYRELALLLAKELGMERKA